MDLDVYFTTNVLETSGKSLGIRHHNVDVAMVVSVGSDVGVTGTVWGYVFLYLWLLLVLSLLRAHVHLSKASLRCSATLCSS